MKCLGRWRRKFMGWGLDRAEGAGRRGEAETTGV